MVTRDEKVEFSMMIETMSLRYGSTHMECIVEYCKQNDLELEVAATLVNPSLKAKLEREARELRFFPKKGKLPI